jgi:hypothetical protein
MKSKVANLLSQNTVGTVATYVLFMNSPMLATWCFVKECVGDMLAESLHAVETPGKWKKARTQAAHKPYALPPNSVHGSNEVRSPQDCGVCCAGAPGDTRCKQNTLCALRTPRQLRANKQQQQHACPQSSQRFWLSNQELAPVGILRSQKLI